MLIGPISGLFRNMGVRTALVVNELLHMPLDVAELSCRPRMRDSSVKVRMYEVELCEHTHLLEADRAITPAKSYATYCDLLASHDRVSSTR